MNLKPVLPFMFGLLSISASAQTTLMHSKVMQASYATGIGNSDAPILYFQITPEASDPLLQLQSVEINLEGTTHTSDITSIKLFRTNHSFGLASNDHVLLSEIKLNKNQSASQTIKFNLSSVKLTPGRNHFWIAADVSPRAAEGSMLDARILSYQIKAADGLKIIAEAEGNPLHSTQVFLSESVLAQPWTEHSKYWRIPAIANAKNGRLVAVMDKRWDSNYDLPNNIDVVARYSDDQGRTWSPFTLLAGTDALGGDYGHGDPVIGYNKRNGDVLVMMVSRSGFFQATPDTPGLIKVCVSHDNGVSWTAPRDITSQIYGSTCSDPIRSKWYGVFAASGAINQTKSGRLMTLICVREKKNDPIMVYMLYSDDNGENWQVNPSPVAYGGDESKVVETADGNLLASIRHRGFRYLNNGTAEASGAVTFGKQREVHELKEPGCNGDLIRYTLQKDGYQKNRLLHSIPFDAEYRANVSLLMSTDEGNTWNAAHKVICPGGSAYSALTILDDGTIGCFYEDDGISDRDNGYTLRFVRFSLSWLTNGADSEPAFGKKAKPKILRVK